MSSSSPPVLEPEIADGQAPPRHRSPLLAGAGVVLGLLYLLNPSAGIFELIPDVLPVVGNLDEAAATTLVVLGLQRIRGAHLARKAADRKTPR